METILWPENGALSALDSGDGDERVQESMETEPGKGVVDPSAQTVEG